MTVSVFLGNWTRLNPLMGARPSYHEFHHSKNIGNYSGMLTLWDTVFGFNEEYYQHLIQEIEKQNQNEGKNGEGTPSS